MRRVCVLMLVLVSSQLLPARQASAPSVSPSLFSEMRWRNIGPYRAGRTKAGSGHPSQPYTFYIGVCNGGVWKTTDAGRTWTPIFNDQPTGSIGSIAVAPSDPNIIYVGSGEGIQRPDLSIGDGMYKSADAGKTWTHLGLRDGQQIPNIAVDPKNPNRLFVAVLGHPYGPNEERGIFRSMDGGATFQKVLYKDADTGGKDVDIDPVNSNIVYATMYESRQGPWENSTWGGSNGGVFKSVDGGNTWTKLTQGLPDNVNQAELAIAPSAPNRLYAVATGAATGGGRAAGGPIGAPIYRSDDAGATWTHITNDSRPATRANEAVPIVDPKNPDSVIVTDVVTYKSVDGGKTYVPFKGAPGGDDYQNAWINPNDPNIILLVSDQGAVVSLNGGVSWSSWYTQLTSALYHVMTDNAFPYRVCGGQQDSGSACVASRGNDGMISWREWHPAGVEEYGYAAPDPLDPDLVYGGKVSRYDRRTGQVSQVGPLSGRGATPPGAPNVGRTVRTLPVVFSQVDPHALFYGTNVLWKTLDGGLNWKQISPDLTRKSWAPPKSTGKYSQNAQTTQGSIGAQVIYTIGPSYRDINRIWIGTDDGVIATTVDGGLNWSDVTPPQIGPFWKVFTVDPGRFDGLTAYAAVNTLRLDDMNPHIYRTHDGGKTWTEIVNGIPGGAPVSVVREDPKKKGLLFAGSETQVYVSFDDGDHWQSLRLNMAASSVRDLVIKDDDVVVGTHGRGIWILDDITPLRQIDTTTANNDAVLFKPTTALRVRWNTNTDTPLPPDEVGAPNPPEGASINYYLKSSATGPVTLEILQRDGRIIRRYSSADPITPLPDPATNAPLPLYWYRQPQSLSAAGGMHRFQWDVHLQPIGGGGGGRGGGLPMQAIAFDTAPASGTPWANPGQYTVKLTVNGKSYTQPITVAQDPRVKTPALVMQQVYLLTSAAYFGAIDAQTAAGEAQHVREQIAALTPNVSGAAATALTDLAKKIDVALTPVVDVPVPVPGAAPPVVTRGGGSAAGAPVTVAPPAAGAAAPPGGRGNRGGGAGGGRGAGAGQGGGANALTAASAALSGVMNSLQAADVHPTANQLAAIEAARRTATGAMARWTAVKTVNLPVTNAALRAAGLAPIAIR